MTTNENMSKIIFTSSIILYEKGYKFQLVDKGYNHSMRRSFVEIVKKYNIPFEIKKVERNKRWLQEGEEIPSPAKSILFISDMLNLSAYDSVRIVNYLIENNIIKEMKKEISINVILDKVKEINSFYQVDYQRIVLDELEKNKSVPFMIADFDLDFYTNSSYAVKYVIDIYFYFILNYARNITIRNEKVYGAYKGCSFDFMGYEEQIKDNEKIKIIKKFESFNEDTDIVYNLDDYNMIYKVLREKYE